MLQAVLGGPRNIEYREAPVPIPEAGQVLVEVKRIGVCGSDIHVYHGRHKYAVFPLVQGHEGSGLVVQTGPDVTNVCIGDRVTLRPQLYCGECRLCREGRYNLCEDYKVIGVLGGTTGMASEYFLTDASKLHRLPDGLDYDAGAMIEPLAVAVHSIRLGQRFHDGNILILGAGPIGNLVGQAAKGMGARSVMITDINPFRLDIAKKCGIDHIVNTATEDLETAIVTHYGRDRADVILDCAATTGTMDQSVKSARRGTNIVTVGNFYDKVPVELGLTQRREINIIGAMNYVSEDYAEAISLLNAGKVKIGDLISAYFGLQDYPAAYQYIDENSNTVMKVLIKVRD
ncbi:MAG: Threonine dehydrogenase and related Zn-dependent dehydrogenase [Anaerosporomusa subterranea]|jgi:L-iditol 2-dehydrogenase|nr:Threonine dehydrogenase and related Zn-dependent dehydrogenase [Anaerosporomusa subterranea]